MDIKDSEKVDLTKARSQSQKKFELVSKYKPSGDQGKVIDDVVKNIQNDGHEQTILGVTGSGKTYMMAKVIEKMQKPTIVIAHNKTLAAQLAEEFKRFFPDNAVHYFVSYYDYYQPESYIPRSDTFIEKQTQINEEIERLRNATTQSLLTRRDVLIVASVSCIYGLGNPEDYAALKIEMEVGQEYKLSKLSRRLIDLQFTRTNSDLKRSTFRIRGDILEIFPTSEEFAYRFMFFGDELEAIERFNHVSGEVLESPSYYTIFPTTQYITTQEKIRTAISTIETDLDQRVDELMKRNMLLPAERIKQRTKNDIEMLQTLGYVSGIENYSIYFDGRENGQAPTTLLDYFPDDSLTFIDESHITLSQISAMYNGDRSRKETLVEYGFRLPSALNNRPLKINEFFDKVGNITYVSATPGDFEMGESNKIGKSDKAKLIDFREDSSKSKTKPMVTEAIIRPTGLLDPEIEIKPVDGQVDDIIARVKEQIKLGNRVLITTLTKKFAEELDIYFKQLNLKSAYIHSDVETLDRLDILSDLRRGHYDILIGINLLREGLDLPEVGLVAIFDADKEGFLRSRTSLIQIVGRAARHVQGRVIMYADNITKSMKLAIDETYRRRAIQKDHNDKNGIIPESTKRELKTIADDVREQTEKDENYGKAGAILTVNGFENLEGKEEYSTQNSNSSENMGMDFEIESRFSTKDKKKSRKRQSKSVHGHSSKTAQTQRGKQVYDNFGEVKDKFIEELKSSQASKEELEIQLQIAIDSLNFEKAAAIRDVLGSK